MCVGKNTDLDGWEELVQAFPFSHLAGLQAPHPRQKHARRPQRNPLRFSCISLLGGVAHFLLGSRPSPHLSSRGFDEVDPTLLPACWGVGMPLSSGQSLLFHPSWPQ